MFKIIIKSKKGSTSILFILLSLSPLFLNIAYTKKASVIIKTNILINTIDNIIHKGNLKNTWNNLSLTEQKKFINYKDFKQFIINKYYPLDITIKNIKYRKETYKILFQIKNNNKYHIPSFYNTHYFTFSLNKNNKLKNLGIFSPNTPIISYSKNTNLIIKIPILMLHRVSPIYPKRNLYSSEYAYLLDYNLTLLSQSFNAQLQYLKNNHYNSITLTRLYDFYYYNLPLPQNPIIISFDDGRLSDFKYALPLLLKYHFKAEFNIITGFVGSINKTQKYMNWKQIETLYKDGMEIESHTVTHVALGILNTAEINYQFIIKL